MEPCVYECLKSSGSSAAARFLACVVYTVWHIEPMDVLRGFAHFCTGGYCFAPPTVRDQAVATTPAGSDIVAPLLEDAPVRARTPRKRGERNRCKLGNPDAGHYSGATPFYPEVCGEACGTDDAHRTQVMEHVKEHAIKKCAATVGAAALAEIATCATKCLV